MVSADIADLLLLQSPVVARYGGGGKFHLVADLQ